MPDMLDGVAAFVANVQAAADRARAGGVRGLGLGAQQVLNVSNSQVPHEEGDLERDGGTSVDAEGMRAAIAYGRTAATKDYAVVQHEDMSRNGVELKLQHDPGRNAKFLENAINSERPTVASIIAEQARRAYQGGAS